MHIPRRKDPVYACHKPAGRGLHVCPAVQFHLEGVCHILLASQKARRDQHNLGIQCFLRSLDLFHIHAARLLILLPCERNNLHGFQVTVFVLHKLLDRGLIDARIVTVNSDSLLLTVIGLTDFWPLRPGVILRAPVRRLGHHLDLGHRLGAMADRRAHTVVSSVAAADDHHVFILRVHILFILKMGVQQALSVGFQEIHRKINSLGVPAGRTDIPRLGGAAAEHHSVEIL